MNKSALVLIIFCFILLMPACEARPSPIGPVENLPPASEAAIPKKPTAAVAAKHNGAINPAQIRLIQFDDPDYGDDIAVISTTEGDIKARLFKAQAPETVGAFIKLAQDGYYNGGKFTEAVDGYKIDGGGKPGGNVFTKEEFSLDLWNFRGAVAVSNDGGHFMIITATHSLNPKSELEEVNFPGPVIQKYLDAGGAPHQDWKHTVFGQVFEGMDVADKIAAGKSGEPVSIIEIRIETF